MVSAPSFDSLVESGRRFYVHALTRQGISATSANLALAKGGDKDLLVRLVASQLVLVYANELALEDQYLPDSATGVHLDRVCGVFGLTRSVGEKATGSITLACTGSVNISAGTQLTAASNGRKYEVTTTYTGAVSGDPISVSSVEYGVSMNVSTGVKMTWSSPPSGVSATALVASPGLTGGLAGDTDSTLRKKLLRLLREPQNGGSWAHVKQWIEESSADVEEAFVYPAAQGPSTTHAAFTVAGNLENLYSREASTALKAVVSAYVLEQYPEHSDLTLTGCADESLKAAFIVSLPEPISSGGLGGGWIDPSSGTVHRWPSILGTKLPVTVTTVSSATVFVVNADSTPIVGASVDFWDSTNLVFVRAKVLSYTGSSGAYTVTVDTSLPTIVAGDYLCPASEQSSEYARIICEEVAKLGPGEKTSDTTILARAYRHPRGGEGSPSGADTRLLARVFNERPEVNGIRFTAINGTASPTLPVEPTVPTTVTDAPNVWRVNELGFYP